VGQKIGKSVMYGLFIGTSISSLVLFVFRIIPISTIGMIIILYLYSIVGGVTGFIVHRMNEVISNKNQNFEKDIDLEKVLENIKEIKKTSFMIRNLIETRKKIEELKNESQKITEDIIERLTANN